MDFKIGYLDRLLGSGYNRELQHSARVCTLLTLQLVALVVIAWRV